MKDPKAVEQACLQATLDMFGDGETARDHAKRIHRIYLDGEYPQTRLIAEGERTLRRGGTWRVSLPIWEFTRLEDPMVSEIERLMYIDIIEA